jgi:hypothetical protein
MEYGNVFPLVKELAIPEKVCTAVCQHVVVIRFGCPVTVVKVVTAEGKLHGHNRVQSHYLSRGSRGKWKAGNE